MGHRIFRVAVFGYGELGVAAVEWTASTGSDVVGVVVPSNRDGPNVDCVKRFAMQRGFRVLVQPPRRDIAPFADTLRRLEPDLILVWSYTMILPPELLSIPRRGCVNVHGGLLPEYRGGHVLQWAIINGEKETGVTLHYLDEGVDTGPIIGQARFPIEWTDDALRVQQKIRSAGFSLLRRWWSAIGEGTAPRIPQDETKARYFRLRTPQDGLIDWKDPNVKIYNLVRALVRPWPGAMTFYRGRPIVIRDALPLECAFRHHAPGRVCALDARGVRVATGRGDLLIREIEADGTTLKARAIRSIGIDSGDRFESHGTRLGTCA